MSAREHHILFLATDAWGGHGGIAQCNRELAEAMALHPRVADVRVLVRHADGTYARVPERVHQDNAAAGSKARFAMRTLRAASTQRFDLVLGGHLNLLPLSMAAAAATGGKHALVVHGVDAWTPHASTAVRALLPRAENVVSVSQVTLDRMGTWAPLQHVRTHVLPNTIRPAAFGPGPRDPALVERYRLQGRKVLLTLARLDAAERYKGVDEILEELPALRADEPSLAYVVAGDGTDRARLELKARELRVAEHVVFAGRVPDGEKVATLRLADAFAMPGRGEGFGIVYLEALACGVPVVGSVLDGSREALRDGALGTLVNPDDRTDLRRGILHALRAGRGDVPAGLAFFDVEHHRARVHAFLDAVLEGRWTARASAPAC